MPHLDQFTATGPAFSGAGYPYAAFSTNREGTDSPYGVNVQGTVCGVYGESLISSPLNRATPEHYSKIGVCGMGNDFGVYGAGNTRVGVYGESENGACGVYGKSLKTKSAGVTGIGQIQRTVPDSSAPYGVRAVDAETVGSTGVIGAGEGGKGFGIIGLSVKDITVNEAVPGGRTPTLDVRIDKDGLPTTNKELDNGVGVLGMSGWGPGVFGFSENGIGLLGRSAIDRGGTFESGKFKAQVRLVPDKQKSKTGIPELPKRGKVGDLFLIRNTSDIEHPEDVPPVDVCSLWLCIPQQGEDSKSEYSNTWQRIQLGSTVIGTGG